MCTFFTELPKIASSIESNRPKNLEILIKPSEPKQFYRFRLLAFKNSSKSDRDYPWIERYVHSHWGKNADGRPIIDEKITCPVTKHVHWQGNAMNDCPICQLANMNFISFKESGWKDREASRHSNEYGRKFEAIIPVWVQNDPNYPKNNNKMKVIIFNDKKIYESFRNLVIQESGKHTVFNGDNAVDFYLRMERITEVVNQGQPNEREWSHNVIKQMGFSTKPYNIPGITKEAVDAFPFDETYYTTVTMPELKSYYKRYCVVSNDDIPEDDNLAVFTQPEHTAPARVEHTNNVSKSTAVANDDVGMPFDAGDDLDDLVSDVVDEPKQESRDSDAGKKADVDDGFMTELDNLNRDDSSDNDISDLDDIDDLLKDV